MRKKETNSPVSSSLNNRRILITGGAGFIGSHLAEASVADGYTVAVVDNFTTGKRENIASLPITLYEIDITDAAALRSVFSDFRPTRVLHHAAQANVRHSITTPELDANFNIIGSINVFATSHALKVEQVVFASSGGAIYGENKHHGVNKEETAKLPLSPYGISKLSAELYGEYFNRLYDLPVTCLRYGNVYGPRQDPKGEAGVITLFLDSFKKGIPPIIFGTGDQVRDFIYISDVVAANRSALNKSKMGTFNISSGQATSISWLLTTLGRIWKEETGQQIIERQEEPPIYGEVYWSALAINRAKKNLSWVPRVGLENGLRQTVRWFIASNPLIFHEKTALFCLDQQKLSGIRV